ncbi:MAG: 4-diphosphocytidyl-2-C-methyl-D-erythritol kinase [Lysobacteraceae bacterium]|nr:MAG: 4-diphosphocytidyl-2-C-methyl-D-erythritol kinase [Xanthomonadaceae bacterium]
MDRLTEYRRVPAPAKVNRFLHVLGRRPDGYHDLQTAFQFTQPSDFIDLRMRDDGSIRRTSSLPGVPPERDLVVRAASLLQQYSNVAVGCDIHVDKAIPTGAGLGGGSSDAASVLVALNRLWHCGVELDALAQLGLQLGSDVPVFIRGHAAWGEGVGERLVAMEFDCPWVLLAVPDVNVSTATIFRDSLLTTHSPPIKMCGSLRGTGNDCEQVTLLRYPAVRSLFDRLSEFGQARMSGTGGSVFVCFETAEAAEQAKRTLPPGLSCWVCQLVNRSPLLEWQERH